MDRPELWDRAWPAWRSASRPGGCPWRSPSRPRPRTPRQRVAAVKSETQLGAIGTHTHDRAARRVRQSGDLEAEVELVRPEPRHDLVRLRCPGDLRRHVVRLIVGVAPGLELGSGVARLAISISARRMSLAIAVPAATPHTATRQSPPSSPKCNSVPSGRTRTIVVLAASGSPAIWSPRSYWSDQNQGTTW